MRVAALLLAVLALAGCGGDDGDAEPEAGGLRDLTALDQLQADFEAAEGKTRVLLLFAPL